LTRPYSKMSVNGASMIFSLVFTVIEWWRGQCYPYQTYWRSFLTKEYTTRSLPCSNNEPPQSVNDLCLCILGSVTNGSGPSLQVRVQVGTEPEPDSRSKSSINPNCQSGYSSIDISLPIWNGLVLCGLFSRSICKYIQHAGLCYLIIVLNQNRLFDIQESHFPCFGCCMIDNILCMFFC
jgi:hypothetical protein